MRPLALVALAAGCQPLPHPFMADRPPAALTAVPDNFDIAVGGFEGDPRAVAMKLPAAVAHELLKHNIPASDQTVSRTSYHLDGSIATIPDQPGRTALAVHWRLRDASGALVAERSDRVVAPTREWEDGKDARVVELAAAGAAGFAALLNHEGPKQAADGGRVRVAIGKIDGAPGDGDSALGSSLSALLKHQDVELVDRANGKPEIAIGASVAVDPVRDGKQHVKVVWHVAHAGGGEIGTVAQENDVPRGRLDGPWGDVAFAVAMAAEGGIMRLVMHGAPPRRPTGEATAAAAPPSLSDIVGAPAVPGPAGKPDTPAAPPVPGNLAAPEVNLPPVSVTPQADSGPTPFASPDVPVLLPRRGVWLPH